MNIENIYWGSYSDYEGPYYRGKISYKSNSVDTFLNKSMYIISSVEGKIDSVNMYDRGIVSLGTVQWIERGNNAVTDMMGYVADMCGISYINEKFKIVFDKYNVSFKRNDMKKWKFFIKKNNKEVEVTSAEMQQECFLGCNGRKGSWTKEARLRAKEWCLCFVNVWESEIAQKAQIKFSADRILSWFVSKNAKQILFSAEDISIDSGWKGAIKSIYLSYSVNIPVSADRNLTIATKNSKFEKWSEEWCLDIIYQMVIGSNIGLWKDRYNKLVSSVKEVYGVSLPVNWKELSQKKWVNNVLKPVVKNDVVTNVVVVDSSVEVLEAQNIIKNNEVEKKYININNDKNRFDNSSQENVKIMLVGYGIFGAIVMFMSQFIDSCK